MEKVLIEIRMTNKDSALKAFVDVTFASSIGDITAQGFRVIKKDERPAWVAFPCISYTKDSKTVNFPVINSSRITKKKLSDAILEEYERIGKSL